jgi:hypothetical protein
MVVSSAMAVMVVSSAKTVIPATSVTITITITITITHHRLRTLWRWLIPIDRSEWSMRAVDYGILIAKKQENVQLVVIFTCAIFSRKLQFHLWQIYPAHMELDLNLMFRFSHHTKRIV